MKYTIEGFNQEETLRLGNIDVIDLVILRWIVDFEPKMTKKIIDNEAYFWINYQSLLEALPILDIKKLALYRRLDKMCNAEILKHKNIKENGNYSYYSFGKNYSNLIISQKIEGISSTIEPYIAKDRTLLSSKIEQNNSSIKEIHLLNNSKENIKEKLEKFVLENNYTKNLKEAISLWFDYKLERKENYKETGLKSLLTQIKNNVNKFGEEKVIEVITASMASNYKGIIFDKLKKDEVRQSTKTYMTNFERSQEALAKARREFESEQKGNI
ncbi:MAG: hypothetical protein KH135_04720 [Firmicutes bacterium]|nr:hypothetical protein [Bacillota bacterium]